MSLGEITSTLAAFFTVLSAIFTGWAAFEARRAVSLTRGATVADLLYDFLQNYYSPQMAQALSTLYAWKEKEGERFIDGWRNVQEPEREEINNARLLVKGYFFSAYRLYQTSVIGDRDLCLFVKLRGYEIFKEIVLPMESRLRKEAFSIWEGDLEEIKDTFERALRRCE